MVQISVIIPLYKGKQYIEGLINCIERNQINFHYGEIELIFINDDPEEKIEINQDSFISIYLYNSQINRGIQESRIQGCKMANGEYILMLDQDDMIMDDCLNNQYENIKTQNADVSVCRVLENQKQIYNATNKFVNIGDREYMLHHINPIVSPGQALIRKEAIPAIWKNNILLHNGSDDWLLWLGMLSERKRFVRNEKILYEHRIDGNNTSWNSVGMLMSERDVLNVIKNEHAFEGEELEKLSELILNDEFRFIQSMEKYRDMFYLFGKWMSLESKEETIADYIYSLGFQSLAVYGYGDIGIQLAKKIKHSRVHLVGAIDRNADYMDTDIPIFTFEKFQEDVQLIVVTIKLPQNILTQLSKKATVMSIESILEGWEQS